LPAPCLENPDDQVGALQEQRNAAGFFLSANAPGSFLLTSP
jgi:hypothetical protein